MLLPLLKLDILFVLERSRDKYTVTLHSIKLSVPCISRREYIFSIIYREIIMRKLSICIEMDSLSM